MNGILRWRTPAAVVALLALTVTVLGRLVEFRAALVAGVGAPRSEAFPALAPGASAYTLCVVAAALVLFCYAAPAVGARRPLAAWGAVLAGVCFLEGLAPLAVGVRSLGLRTAVGVALVPLATLALPFLACALLVAAGLSRGAQPVVVEDEAPPVAEEAAVPEVEVPTPDPEQQPTWSTDTAAGAVWRSAGDAARGVPGGAWGATDASGWGRVEEPAELPAIGTGPEPPAEDERPTSVR